YMDRWKRIDIHDAATWANQAVSFTRQLWNMLELARVITLGALRRDESRGSHYKPDFPDRNDGEWLKTTLATWTPSGPELRYAPVDISLLKPEARKY
ncbi:MAG: succinate dehydrogenase flavoprotein subunit, partial [candidate division NC10 bacterium]|nr:succinate dehydrogenase flavoprotein subunit [candidate division NC10 bacterium]